MNHKFISLVIALASVFTASAQVKNISTAVAERKMQKKNVVVLDVRTTKEYNEAHLANAVQIDVLDSVAFLQQVQQLDKTKKYIVYCRSGKRSAKAAGILSQLGFKQIWNMEGGITAWKGETIKQQ